MSLFQQEKVFKKIFYSWITLAFFIYLIFLLVEQIYTFYYKSQKIQSKIDVNNKKIENLNKDINSKKEDYNFLTSKRGQEEYYRDIYLLGKEGERVMILYNSTTSDSVEIIEVEPSFWQNIRNKIKYFVDNYTNL